MFKHQRVDDAECGATVTARLSSWEWHMGECTKLSQHHGLGRIASAERSWPVGLALPSEGFQWLWSFVKAQTFLPWGAERSCLPRIRWGIPPACSRRAPCLSPPWAFLTAFHNDMIACLPPPLSRRSPVLDNWVRPFHDYIPHHWQSVGTEWVVIKVP